MFLKLDWRIILAEINENLIKRVKVAQKDLQFKISHYGKIAFGWTDTKSQCHKTILKSTTL